MKMTLEFLVWHCAHCDHIETIHDLEVKEGDWIPCDLCKEDIRTARKATIILENK